MPTEERIFETSRDHINFHHLPYLLSDSMPDDFGNELMKEWLRQKAISYDKINPVDRLTYVGKRGMGALEYQPYNHRENNEYLVEVSELLDVAKKVLEGKKDTSFGTLDKDSLINILRIGTSVGGARAKALVALKRGDHGEIDGMRPGDILQPEGWSYWLLKIDGANKKSLGESEGMGKLEYAYYKMAKEAGIDISESKLIEENDRFHFLTKRFDRTDSGKRIHMQTWGALAGIDYRVPKASSYETLFRVMKRLRLAYPQIEQQYRRMIFNVLARNHDDHVKNFSFLMSEDGTWKISPAYDLCFSFSPGGIWTREHQSSINGKFDHFKREDLMDFATTFGIKKATRIIEEVKEAVSRWPVIAAELDIPQERIHQIHNLFRLDI
jgi:serine/threonine-protein kinase HipA